VLRFLFAVFPAILFAGSYPKTALAVRTPNPPRIDGRLDDSVWQLARAETTFTQYEPIEGAPPDQKTEVRFLYDEEALYVGCRMYDTDPSGIVARLARRDDEIESDYISIRIDSYADNQTDFEFTVNAAGVKTDILEFDDGARQDASWDPVWDVSTSIDEQGWVAEFKIPFQALRFNPSKQYDWGLQILRRVSRTQERLYWVLIRKSENGWASKFGHLKGISDISTSTHVEILPYVLGEVKTLPTSSANPDRRDLAANAGFDLKYRPNVGLTVDATINPDFGQVEADPAVLNLTTFQTFYPEKRPFFIEGSQIFRFSTFGDNAGPGLFYSRRIGRSINVNVPPGGYVQDQPNFATILGAAKISGKTENGLSIGVLEAMTKRERATLVDSLGNKSTRIVEPLSNFSLVRLKQDVLENSNVGVIVTNVSRDATHPAITGGLDWNVRFFESVYRLDGFLAISHTTMSDTIVQNPSGGYHAGPAGRITLNKEGGTHWRWSLDYDFTSKGFNVNDMGFFRRPNDRGSVNYLTYRDDVPGSFFRRWFVTVGYHYRTNYDGAELFNAFAANVDFLLLDYWDLSIEAETDQGKYDDRETRGNGLYRKPATRSVYFGIQSDPRERVVGSADIRIGADRHGSKFLKMDAAAEWKLATNFSIQFALLHNEQSNEFAWSANLPDTTSPPNLISLFADRTTSDWSLISRGSWVFTRDLTLQYYVQVFFAKGKYERVARLVSPDHSLPYAYSQPDFNILSLNSNLVLRWEYMPGSTAYFVWSQARNGNVGSYLTSFSRNFGNTFSLPATDVFLLKISYWLSY
jgi:hypothetical protein